MKRTPGVGFNCYVEQKRIVNKRGEFRIVNKRGEFLVNERSIKEKSVGQINSLRT